MSLCIGIWRQIIQQEIDNATMKRENGRQQKGGDGQIFLLQRTGDSRDGENVDKAEWHGSKKLGIPVPINTATGSQRGVVNLLRQHITCTGKRSLFRKRQADAAGYFNMDEKKFERPLCG
jgi:hypothetical protein